MFSTSKSLTRQGEIRPGRGRRRGLLGFAALPAPVQAFSSPFTAMSGSWSGSGTITTSNGNKERIRCRAKYDVDGAGSNLDLTLRCASDSYNFELQSNVAHKQRRRVRQLVGEHAPRRRQHRGQRPRQRHQRAGLGRDLGDARRQHQRQPAVDLDPGSRHRIAVGGDLDEPRLQVALSSRVASVQFEAGCATRAPGFVYSVTRRSARLAACNSPGALTC